MRPDVSKYENHLFILFPGKNLTPEQYKELDSVFCDLASKYEHIHLMYYNIVLPLYKKD